MAIATPHEPPSKPLVDESYPISMMRSRTTRGISTYDSVVTSPATTTRPVVTRHSTATRLSGSCRSSSSSTESLIWSAILSGCPSVTDSEVNSLPAMGCHPFLSSCAPTALHGRAGPTVPRKLPAGALRECFVPNLMRKRVFASGEWPGCTLRGQQSDLTVRSAKDQIVADLVENQQVAAFTRQLGTAQVEQCLSGTRSLRCKADQDLTGVGPRRHETGEYVGGLHQPQRKIAVGRLLDLALTGAGRCEVGGCRRHHRDVGVLGSHGHGLGQIRS